MTGHRVQDVMTREVVVVEPECGYGHLVDTLVDFKLSAVPVVDDGVVVGIVSEADLLRTVESGAEGDGQAARDLMCSPVITIDPAAPVGTAARVMERRRIKRLPVIDPVTRRLVGIVSRRDLLRPHLRPDDEIRKDVATRVMRDSLWVDPAAMEILVHDGRGVLRGRVDRRTTAAIAVRLVAALDGVVSVDDELTWEFDDVAVSRRVP